MQTTGSLSSCWKPGVCQSRGSITRSSEARSRQSVGVRPLAAAKRAYSRRETGRGLSVTLTLALAWETASMVAPRARPLRHRLGLGDQARVRACAAGRAARPVPCVRCTSALSRRRIACSRRASSALPAWSRSSRWALEPAVPVCWPSVLAWLSRSRARWSLPSRTLRVDLRGEGERSGRRWPWRHRDGCRRYARPAARCRRHWHLSGSVSRPRAIWLAGVVERALHRRFRQRLQHRCRSGRRPCSPPVR